MPLYVFAIVDAPLRRQARDGRLLHARKIARGVHAVLERRPAAPPATDDELRWQHRLVVDLAERAEAILPVRFGSLLEETELDAFAAAHEEEIRGALDHVRGRSQMTLRVLGTRAAPSPPPAARPARTGREFLLRRQRASAVPLPRYVTGLLRAVAPLVHDERRERGVGRLLLTAYHLVGRGDVRPYQQQVAQAAAPGVVLTGPWPPFAFAPRLL